MKKKFIIVLAIVMAFGMFAVGCGGNSNAELDAALDQVVTRDDGKSLAGLGVAVVKDGEVAYTYAGGNRYIDNENSENNLPFQTDTKMRIASVSKTFVAVAIMQQVEAGKIDLDEDVSKYLGFDLVNPNYPDIPITCRMLMSHTSGLRDGGEGDVYSAGPDYTLQDFFVEGGKLYNDGVYFAGEGQKPGEYFSYCNLNYGVLGTIVEAVTGERFDKYMYENVIEPMGITASYNIGLLGEEDMANLATLYRKDYDDAGWAKSPEWIPQIDDYGGQVQDPDQIMISNPDSGDELELVNIKDYVPGTNATFFSPQGGLRISVDELATYCQMYINDGVINDNQILTKESIDEMFTPVWTWNGKEEGTNGDAEWGLFACYGAGIHIITNGEHNDGYGDTFLEDKKLNVAGHYGDAHGAFSLFMIDRELGNAYIYACNGTECDYYNEPSYGAYSENWIWEEEIMTAIDTYLFGEE